MSAKYNSEKKVLCNAALSAYLKKQMSHAQLCTAMRLALDHQSHHWAVTLRLSLTWMAASARRSIDARLMTYRSMCVQETRQATAQEPWVRLTCSLRSAFVMRSQRHIDTHGPGDAGGREPVQQQSALLRGGRREDFTVWALRSLGGGKVRGARHL